MAMYCIRLAKSHEFLSFDNSPFCSGASCSGTGIASEWLRFRDPIAAGQPSRPVLWGVQQTFPVQIEVKASATLKNNDKYKVHDAIWKVGLDQRLLFFSCREASRCSIYGAAPAARQERDHVRVGLNLVQISFKSRQFTHFQWFYCVLESGQSMWITKTMRCMIFINRKLIHAIEINRIYRQDGKHIEQSKADAWILGYLSLMRSISHGATCGCQRRKENAHRR